ncbi:hypothetical protein LTR04_001698, partial [Oleoguttula sp. CCFEE 6159]
YLSREKTEAINLEATSSDDYDAGVKELISVTRPLHDDTQANVHYLVKFLVQRALTVTKTGDQPYRSLLEIFTEDFISVLGSVDWPAAELLLRVLLSNMAGLIENQRSTVSAKTIALDLMGLMGSAIMDLQICVRHPCRSLDTSQSDLAKRLVQLSGDILDDKLDATDLLELGGLYRVITEYLGARGADDPQLHSAHAYYLAQWAKHFRVAYQARSSTEVEMKANENVKLASFYNGRRSSVRSRRLV